MSDTSNPLDRIEVRYATFRDRPGHERAGLADRLRDLRAGERVLLDTCHRVELITLDAEAGEPPAELRGVDAVRRVFAVIAGFDSAVVAEEQLLGQVRAAYEGALSAGWSGPVLNELMRRALRFGRQVRSHARPGTDRSLADPGVAWVRERIPIGARVVVAGTGEMGSLVAHRLANAGHPVTVISTSAERGTRLLESLPGTDHRLAVGSVRDEVDASCAALVLAVRTRVPVLIVEDLPAGRLPWVLDLSSPSAVDPAAGDRLGDRLLDLDRLGELHVRAPVLAPGVEKRLRRRMDDEVLGFVTWLDSRHGADALTLLHREADAVRRRHLERLRRRADLDEQQLAAVEAASSAMLGELLHGPTVELRAGGADAATVRRLFRIEE